MGKSSKLVEHHTFQIIISILKLTIGLCVLVILSCNCCVSGTVFNLTWGYLSSLDGANSTWNRASWTRSILGSDNSIRVTKEEVTDRDLSVLGNNFSPYTPRLIHANTFVLEYLHQFSFFWFSSPFHTINKPHLESHSTFIRQIYSNNPQQPTTTHNITASMVFIKLAALAALFLSASVVGNPLPKPQFSTGTPCENIPVGKYMCADDFYWIVSLSSLVISFLIIIFIAYIVHLQQPKGLWACCRV